MTSQIWRNKTFYKIGTPPTKHFIYLIERDIEYLLKKVIFFLFDYTLKEFLVVFIVRNVHGLQSWGHRGQPWVVLCVPTIRAPATGSWDKTVLHIVLVKSISFHACDDVPLVLSHYESHAYPCNMSFQFNKENYN